MQRVHVHGICVGGRHQQVLSKLRTGDRTDVASREAGMACICVCLMPQPLFLYLPFQNIHWPLEAPDKYMRMYENKTDGDKRRQTVGSNGSG